jgi:hypothetical protein
MHDGGYIKKGEMLPALMVTENNPLLLFFKYADHIVIFDDERFFTAAPVNPLFLGCPFLLDDFFLVRFAKKKKQRFLEDPDFKTAIFEAGFVGLRKIGVFLQIFVDFVRALFYELISPAGEATAAAAKSGKEQPFNHF